MTWTTRADLRAQAQKLWDKGDLLRALIDPTAWQPRRLRLVVPTSGELGDQIERVRAWLDDGLLATVPLDTGAALEPIGVLRPEQGARAAQDRLAEFLLAQSGDGVAVRA